MTSGRMASITLGLALVVTAVAMPMEGSPPATGLQPPAEIPVSNPPAGSPDEAPVADPDFVKADEGVEPAGAFPPAVSYLPEGDDQPTGGESPEGESSPAHDSSNFDYTVYEDYVDYGEYTPDPNCERLRRCVEFGIDHVTLGKNKIPFSNFVQTNDRPIDKENHPAWTKNEGGKPDYYDLLEIEPCIQAMKKCQE